MNTLTYNIAYDIHTYVITCSDEMLDMYMDLLFDNGAYKVTINNKTALFSKQHWVAYKNAK